MSDYQGELTEPSVGVSEGPTVASSTGSKRWRWYHTLNLVTIVVAVAGVAWVALAYFASSSNEIIAEPFVESPNQPHSPTVMTPPPPATDPTWISEIPRSVTTPSPLVPAGAPSYVAADPTDHSTLDAIVHPIDPAFVIDGYVPQAVTVDVIGARDSLEGMPQQCGLSP